jgi:hypothetical protein
MFRFDVVDVDMIQKQGVQPEISLRILLFSHIVTIIHVSSKMKSENLNLCTVFT